MVVVVVVVVVVVGGVVVVVVGGVVVVVVVVGGASPGVITMCGALVGWALELTYAILPLCSSWRTTNPTSVWPSARRALRWSVTSISYHSLAVDRIVNVPTGAGSGDGRLSQVNDAATSPRRRGTAPSATGRPSTAAR